MENMNFLPPIAPSLVFARETYTPYTHMAQFIRPLYAWSNIHTFQWVEDTHKSTHRSICRVPNGHGPIYIRPIAQG